jgi:hypothetical protein
MYEINAIGQIINKKMKNGIVVPRKKEITKLATNKP